MPRILVVSDSHGSIAKLGRIIDREYPFDYLVHCGDGAEDLNRVAIPGDVTVVSVTGNMDPRRGDGTRIACVTVGSVRFMAAHGDQYQAHSDLEWLEREGRCMGVDLVLFGHTHVKYFREGKPSLFNPGPANRGQYGVVVVDRSIHFSHHALED